jgi:G:T-mismatch repair DNA endonuclease (very short patch repair protein)
MKKRVCPFCKKILLTQYSYEKHMNDEHQNMAFICKICNKSLFDIKGLMTHLSRCHNINKEKYWDDYIFKMPQCPRSKDTNEYLTYKEYKNNHGFKHQINYYKYRHPCNNVNYTCQICNAEFEKTSHLAKHLSTSHPEITSEEYYRQYFLKEGMPIGKCLWCEKKLKFLNFTKGYQKFCYNTNCNVNYYNKHKNRHKNSGKNISKAHKKNQNLPTQIGHWLKKGYTQEQAQALVAERQKTNTIENIAKRNKCSIKEAKDIRKSITEKWLKTLDKKSPEEKQRILLLKVGKGYTVSKAEKEIKEQLEKIIKITHTFPLQSKNTGYVFDFKYKNKLIEYNGDFWHCNPKIYNKEFYNKRTHRSAVQQWERDKQKIEFAKDLGFKVLTIWENDYNKNKTKTIEECLKFLNE